MRADEREEVMELKDIMMVGKKAVLTVVALVVLTVGKALLTVG